ncbi:hypothetical protein AVEN_166794-1 [Araneus ventricosus]|uniref:Uncharacterized protein n=1 Tax=Araneus ventricosus TaxID=182803 RepID=A0A4Y2BPX5_ARAVE|nr:hypothetical protein AVEN_166794-1 [Araneus ventricosus]
MKYSAKIFTWSRIEHSGETAVKKFSLFYQCRNSYGNRPDLEQSRPVHLSDSLGSSVEAGVLMAITGHGPTSPVGGTHYRRQRASSIQPYYCTHQGGETPLTYPVAFHPCTRGVPQWDRRE